MLSPGANNNKTMHLGIASYLTLTIPAKIKNPQARMNLRVSCGRYRT